MRNSDLNVNEINTQLSLSSIQILSRLGRGSTSHVFKVQSTKSKRYFAMKVIDKTVENYNRKALDDQLSIHRPLSHPNIVRFASHLQDADNHYVFSQYCSGGQLSSLILEDISEFKIAIIGYQIALGLQYLHQSNIVHCDLKLSNVLIANGLIKICDFGFSQKEKDNLSQSEGLFGTLLYLSPEIIKSKRRNYPKQSDIWAYGVCLMALLNRGVPYPTGQSVNLKEKIMLGEFNKVKSLSKELNQMLNQILQVDPLKRITIQQLVEHPFFKKYKVKQLYQGLIEGKSKKMSEIFQNKSIYSLKKEINSIQRRKSVSSILERKEQNIDHDKKRQRTESVVAQQFKRVQAPEQSIDATLTKPITMKKHNSEHYDMNQTIKIQKTLSQQVETSQKETKIVNESSKQKKLKKIEAKLIQVIGERKFETKNGWIIAKFNNSLQMSLKGFTFDILENGSLIKFSKSSFTFEDLSCNKAQKLNFTEKKEFIRAKQLYQYAFDIVEILKSRQYCKYQIQSDSKEQRVFGMLIDKKHFVMNIQTHFQKSELVICHLYSSKKFKLIRNGIESIMSIENVDKTLHQDMNISIESQINRLLDKQREWISQSL